MSEILVLAEIENGTLHSTAGELLAAARKLAAELNLDVSAALFGEITEDITGEVVALGADNVYTCLLYTSPSPRDGLLSRMPSSA